MSLHQARISFSPFLTSATFGFFKMVFNTRFGNLSMYLPHSHQLFDSGSVVVIKSRAGFIPLLKK